MDTSLKNGKSTPTKTVEQKPVPTPKVPTQEEPKENPKELGGLTINQKIEKLQSLQKVADRRETLLSTQKKLTNFKLSTEGLNDTLIIRDGEGNEFLTHNTNVIKDVISLIRKGIELQIEQAEQEINF